MVCFTQQINQLFQADSKAVKLNLVSTLLNVMYKLILGEVLLAYDGAGLQNYSVDLLRKLDFAMLTVFSNHVSVRGVVIPNNAMAMAYAKLDPEDDMAIWQDAMRRQKNAAGNRCHELGRGIHNPEQFPIVVQF